ncbi:hypothetical protein AAG570_013839 [Ranatra chinensis]|uniref:Platelet-derived growth factor (PDGF) family profile domain-containing protein n=1 Tax=Ranatra chinensis TaxID=642074 RepID=A0ABD0YDC2_9HEMI
MFLTWLLRLMLLSSLACWTVCRPRSDLEDDKRAYEETYNAWKDFKCSKPAPVVLPASYLLGVPRSRIFKPREAILRRCSSLCGVCEGENEVCGPKKWTDVKLCFVDIGVTVKGGVHHGYRCINEKHHISCGCVPKDAMSPR